MAQDRALEGREVDRSETSPPSPANAEACARLWERSRRTSAAHAYSAKFSVPFFGPTACCVLRWARASPRTTLAPRDHRPREESGLGHDPTVPPTSTRERARHFARRPCARGAQPHMRGGHREPLMRADIEGIPLQFADAAGHELRALARGGSECLRLIDRPQGVRGGRHARELEGRRVSGDGGRQHRRPSRSPSPTRAPGDVNARPRTTRCWKLCRDRARGGHAMPHLADVPDAASVAHGGRPASSASPPESC